ncbi:MAG TPA: nuclear transport factor 2 family protein [Nannocystis sp.]|jgi:ketosteroid isomerase-like protein
MRPLALALALALAPLAGLGCAHAGGFTGADRDAIVALLAAQQSSWNRGDLEGFLRGYERSQDLLFTSGGEVRRGYAATRAQYQARYLGMAGATGTPDRSKMGQLAFTVRDVRGLGRDGAIVLGEWRLTGTPEAGEGVFSLAFFRTRAGWRIVHDHTSLATP